MSHPADEIHGTTLQDALWMYWQCPSDVRRSILAEQKKHGQLLIFYGLNLDAPSPWVRTQIANQVRTTVRQMRMRAPADIAYRTAAGIAVSQMILDKVDFEVAHLIEPTVRYHRPPDRLLLLGLRAGLSAAELDTAVRTATWPHPDTLRAMAALRAGGAG